MDEGNGFRLKWTVSETSGVAGRVRQEELMGREREGRGERIVCDRNDGGSKKMGTYVYTVYPRSQSIFPAFQHCMLKSTSKRTGSLGTRLYTVYGMLATR